MAITAPNNKTKKPDIGFLIGDVATSDNNLYQALLRLRQSQLKSIWTKTMTYVGALTVGEEVLTHSFRVSLPAGEKLVLKSMIPTLTVLSTSRLEVKFKRRSASNSAWEEINKGSNVFLEKDVFFSETSDFAVLNLFDRDELQMDIISTGGASNLQVMIRAERTDI